MSAISVAENNGERMGLNDSMDVSVSNEKTLAEPSSGDIDTSLALEPECDGVDENLERERDSLHMAIDGEVLGDSERSEPGVVEVGSNVCSMGNKSIGEISKDSGADLVGIEGSDVHELVPEPLYGDRFGIDESIPNVEKTSDGDGNVAEVSYSGGLENVAVADSETNRVHATEGGLDDSKGVNVVVDLDECVKRDGEDSKNKGGFCASDLVWGKVRSHPWWPGQIFEPEDASDMARKYSRSKSYLVAYFGDQTFAWNDEAKLKPFVSHFSQTVKQTSLEAFHHAVGCALDEVSRRVEFGLSCHCIADEVYNRLKTQVVENAGIREQSSVREGGDRFLTAFKFEPVKLIDYVKGLAQEPHVVADRLEHVMAKAQMSAFYRWKGYYHLAEFGSLIGYVNNEADSPKEDICKVSDASKGSLKEHDSRPQKRKSISGNNSHSMKKVKHLSKLSAKKGSHKEDDDAETEAAGSKSVSSSVKRGKVARSLDNVSKTESCSPQSTGKTDMISRDLKSSFRVGESILRVAGKLSQPSPLLKLDVSCQGRTTKGKGGSEQSRRQTKVVPADYAPDEILLELQCAAMEPLKDQHLLNSMVDFFSDFRNSVVVDCSLLQKHEETVWKDAFGMFEEMPAQSGPAEMDERCSSGIESKEKAFDSQITMMVDSEAGEDVNCADKVISVPDHQTFSSDENEALVGPEPSKVDGVSALLPEVGGTDLGSELSSVAESVVSGTGQLDEKLLQEDSPTALTLKFTDMDSIPSETKLNKIFSHFGPLKESQTEVLSKKNCARVVFKRRSDAETAFSSSGKFETFGPSLVCYRLNYAPSPRKSPSAETKRRRKDGSPVEDSAA